MPLTVAELVAQPQLGLSVRAGAAGCGAQIRWAHASELPDPSPWMRGGELLLTTGLALPADADGQAAYLHRLADAGAAGVAFGTGVNHAQLPAALIQVADARGLALLEVPLPVPFIAITEAVAERHAADQQETTARLVEVLRAMTRAALRQGPAGVLRALTGSLGGSAVALDEYGGVLAEAGPDAAAVLDDGREELDRRTGSGGPFSAMVSAGDQRLVVQSIGGGARPRGHLLLRTAAEWSTYAQLVLAQANSLLSITVEKPDVVLVAERRLRAELLTSVLDGTRPAELAGQLAAFGFGEAVPVVAVALEPASRAPAAPAGAPGAAAAPAGVVGAAELAEAASRLLERQPAAQLVTVRDGRVLLLLAIGEADDGEATAAAVDGLLDGLLHGLRLPAAAVSAGVSGPLPLSGAADAVTQALLAARAARVQGRSPCRFGELSTYTLLLASHSPQALTQVAGSALEPLLAHDRHRGTRLLETLGVFLAHNAQAVPAAAALGVHRHTLRNRIRKVAELTGRDLDSPHDRTELWLALQAWEIAQVAPRPAEGQRADR